MRRLFCIALLVALAACKDPQKAEAERTVGAARTFVEEGRDAMKRGRAVEAVQAFKQAISQTPRDVSLYVLLAEAYRKGGNETGAVLTLKQAEAVAGKADPSLQRARADLFLLMRQRTAAITELKALRDAELLTDQEILDLARLEAREGDFDGAFTSLGRVQARLPDSVEAKVVEAEILQRKGDELLAARLMDRLLEENSELTSARVLRARYFLSNGHPELSEKDLALVAAVDEKTAEVVTLKATVLTRLGRSEEAALILEPLVLESPDDFELMAFLAEIRLSQGHAADARVLVDKVLAIKPKYPRALYVRGRASEEQGHADAALADYLSALREDANFSPALTRLWPLHEKRGNKAEAMSALERLFLLGEISSDEKVALARFSAETGSQVARARKLIDEALERDPKNPEYREIKKRLARVGGGAKKSGVVIMRGR